jgi:hypothetical protein
MKLNSRVGVYLGIPALLLRCTGDFRILGLKGGGTLLGTCAEQIALVPVAAQQKPGTLSS